MPGKGNEDVDVNHKQATESSEDDEDALLELAELDENFDWENEDNYVDLEDDVHIDSDLEWAKWKRLNEKQLNVINLEIFKI